MPMDAQANMAGNLARTGELSEGLLVVEVVPKGQKHHRDPLRFMPHFATCPTVAQHRKAQR